MFDTGKFGLFIAHLRKKADMTQSELGDLLNVTRQAISKYERGESFPDVSVLKRISEIFGVSTDILINSGDPTGGEAKILTGAAEGVIVKPDSMDDVVSLAPLLKPSMLMALSESMAKQGVDISHLVSLAEYINDSDAQTLLKNVTFDNIGDMDMTLLERLLPLLGWCAVEVIFDKIIKGELDENYLEVIGDCYVDSSLVEAAVIYGALSDNALRIIRRHSYNLYRARRTGKIPTVFRCPKCGQPLKNFYPSSCNCGFRPSYKDDICLLGDPVPAALTRSDCTLHSDLGLRAGENPTVLLAGCGCEGYTLHTMDMESCEVIIADSDIDRLEAVSEKLRHNGWLNVMYVLTDMRALSLADSSVDAVIDTAGIPPEEKARITRPGGVELRDGKIVGL